MAGTRAFGIVVLHYPLLTSSNLSASQTAECEIDLPAKRLNRDGPRTDSSARFLMLVVDGCLVAADQPL